MSGAVVLEMSMSLDGFVAGPNVGDENPLGEEGDRLHDWMFADKTGEEIVAFERAKFSSVGAVVTGRRTFDLGEKPWGDEPTFGVPVFVVSHRAHEPIAKKGGTTYRFVTDGVESAVRQARAAARDKEVVVLGGAAIAQQCLAAGLVDELRINLVPILLGAGTRLFERIDGGPIALEKVRVSGAPGVTHLTYRRKEKAVLG